jgi:hypothetical protein
LLAIAPITLTPRSAGRHGLSLAHASKRSIKQRAALAQKSLAKFKLRL